MKLIDLHKEWCKKDMLPHGGLCKDIPQQYKKEFSLIKPTNQEKHISLREDGYGFVFWGKKLDESVWGYSPLRQTIVLLICAMNNEL